ncbi:hypothetical protein TSAR_008417 [Trichomalopsis sarcophagae]|uniref:Uncharacterized protein n=1 Tax=Trichomalopsis sarcophagae TaxID=543379 RepID=A0A232FKL0_9HYME|nr:hypothetical protein TSAR_008417 [Trichomalopsis sarcophagae]
MYNDLVDVSQLIFSEKRVGRGEKKRRDSMDSSYSVLNGSSELDSARMFDQYPYKSTIILTLDDVCGETRQQNEELFAPEINKLDSAMAVLFFYLRRQIRSKRAIRLYPDESDSQLNHRDRLHKRVVVHF